MGLTKNISYEVHGDVRGSAGPVHLDGGHPSIRRG